MNLKYTTTEQAKEAAQHAQRCVSLIRNGLPIQGTESIPPVLEQDSWFQSAGEAMIQFRKFYPVHGPYCVEGPQDLPLYWRRMADAMMEIVDHYGWQDVDGVNKLPYSNARGGKSIPPIEPALLERVDRAANWLLDLPPETDEEQELSSVEKICRELPGRGPAIYRYLASHPNGVTFSAFMDYREPTTGYRLTESEDIESIAAMLRKLSSKLSRFGERIEAKRNESIIRLSSRK